MRLYVNIDHVATVRQARRTDEPDPVRAAVLAELGGADGITIHLREDRRHIQESDVIALKEQLTIPLNLEMAATAEMVAFALQIKPKYCCIVPERRQELTTEGGLDVSAHQNHLQPIVAKLERAGITVALFIDPSLAQVKASHDVGASEIELHTGAFCALDNKQAMTDWLNAFKKCIAVAHDLELTVNAGHGLHKGNIHHVACVPGISVFNIGHSIISDAVFLGLHNAVSEMKAKILAHTLDVKPILDEIIPK